MEATRKLVVNFLTRLEDELKARVSLAQVNSLLSLGDPALVLPAPAIALMSVDCRESVQPTSSMVFRSLEPLGPEGELLFGPVDPEVVFHPWRVGEVSFVPSPEMSAVGPVLRIKLTRPEDSTCAPGWLALYTDAGATLAWAAGRARVSCDGARLRSRRPDFTSGLREIFSSSLGVVSHRLMALAEQLLLVEVPAALASRVKLSLDFHLEPGLNMTANDSIPRVLANVCLVWNSLDCRYPSFPDVEPVVADNGDQYVHALVPRALGNSWKAWSMQRVGATADARTRLHARPVAGTRGEPSPSLLDYHLAYLPANVGREDAEGPQHAGLSDLAVILRADTREGLRRRGQKLSVDYRATLGAAANGVPAGSEFQLIDTSGFPVRERVVGRLESTSAGGTDGPFALNGSGAPGLNFLLPVGRRRTVGEVCSVLESAFGHDLQLVDERDFVRSAAGSTVPPLHVRVRFHRPDRPAIEKWVILRACQTFLERYLAADAFGRLTLIEQESSHEIQS